MSIQIKYLDKIFKVDQEIFDNAPVIKKMIENNVLYIKNIPEDTFMFIFKYLEFYKNNTELDPPINPLDNALLSELFESEPVFEELFENTDSNIKLLLSIIEYADKFELKKLKLKLCAILMAHIQA